MSNVLNNDIMNCVMSYINQSGSCKSYKSCKQNNAIDVYYKSTRLILITFHYKSLYLTTLSTPTHCGEIQHIQYSDPDMFSTIDECINISIKRYEHLTLTYNNATC